MTVPDPVVDTIVEAVSLLIFPFLLYQLWGTFNFGLIYAQISNKQTQIHISKVSVVFVCF